MAKKHPGKKKQRCNLSLHFRDKSGLVHKDPIVCKLVTIPGLYLVVKLLEKHHCELCWVHMMLRCCTDLWLSSCIYMTLTGKIVTPAELICTSTSIMQFCMASVHSVSYVLVHFTLQDWRFRNLSKSQFGGRSLLNSLWVYGYAPCCVVPSMLHPPKWSTWKKSWR